MIPRSVPDKRTRSFSTILKRGGNQCDAHEVHPKYSRRHPGGHDLHDELRAHEMLSSEERQRGGEEHAAQDHQLLDAGAVEQFPSNGQYPEDEKCEPGQARPKYNWRRHPTIVQHS